jgi:alkanesulfonate monooxygenase SsuD/methylene tetrahydromethanopterin reductase-like flavin-dependent oxidoreductase (luciferase family)
MSVSRAEPSLVRSRVSSFSANRLKLGLFGLNLSNGRAATTVPERWSGNWQDNLAAARMADEAAMDFHLPVGRWKGYRGPTRHEGYGLESTMWACGILAHTERIHVFATVHAPLVHPVLAAKQFVTADHIGRGRFGLNIVCGWNADEFEMFGMAQREHDDRYAYGGEWIDTIYRLWSEPGSFDVNGTYLQLKDVEAEPKPYGGTRPIVMNAGSSAAGRAFSLRHADMLFRNWRSYEANGAENAETKAAAAANGREIGIYTSGFVVCRKTRQEALDYERYVEENADWEGIDHLMEMIMVDNHAFLNLPPELLAIARKRFAHGGGCRMVGDPDDIVDEMRKLSEAGFDGFGFSFVNYIQEFPFFRDEVLPRLERAGLRRRAP